MTLRVHELIIFQYDIARGKMFVV